MARAAGQGAPTWGRSRRLGLGALLLFAAAIRALAWSRTAALFDDGPVFIYLAEAMAAGEWRSVLHHPYHPLYSVLVWWTEPLVGDFESAAAAVSIAAGVASVGVLFGFLRDAFDERTAWIGAGLLAMHPTAVAFSSDVQSDGLYVALFLGSAWAGWRAMRDVRIDLAGCAGLLAGLAYLVRPEGLGVALAGTVGVGWLALRGHWGKRRAALWCAVFAIGAAAIAAPYVSALHAETGRWTLTQKKSLVEMASLKSQPSGASAVARRPPRRIPTNGPLPSGPIAAAGVERDGAGERLARAFDELQLAVVPALRVELIGFLAVGLWALRGRPGHRGLFVIALIGLYAFVLFALAASAGYVSRRHALPPLLLLFGYIAYGVPILGRQVLQGAARLFPRLPANPGWGLSAGFALAFVATFFLPISLAERRTDRLAERRAAEWLREAAGDPRIVASRRIRAAYYADADFVAIPSGGYPPDQLLRYLRRRGVRHLIIDEGRVDLHAGLREARELGMERMHRSEAAGRTAAVYLVRPAAGS